MPYTAGPVLASMQNRKEASGRKNYLMRMRDRRMEEQASALEARKVEVTERKQEFEEQKTKREYASQQQMVVDRKAALQSLPEKPSASAPPEVQSAWYNHAAETMARQGYDDSAQKFLDIGNQMYGQGVESPGKLALDMSTEDVNYSRADLNRAEVGAIESGEKYAPTPAKPPKPMPVIEQIKTDDAINSVAQESMLASMTDLTTEEMFDDANVATGEFIPTMLNASNERWWINTYRSWVDTEGVEEAKRIMESSNKVIRSSDTTSWYQGSDVEEFIVPKGYIQELEMRLGHSPTNEEIIENWKYNLGAFEQGE